MYYNSFFNREVEYDTWTNEDAYEVRIDVPGVAKEKVEVFAKDNYLDISWEREKEGGFRRKAYGEKKISFKLPNDVSVSKIKSSLDNGVLKLSLPKSARGKPKKIPVLTE